MTAPYCSIRCPDCHHDIDLHSQSTACWFDECDCIYAPSDIARALLSEKDVLISERDAVLTTFHLAQDVLDFGAV